MVTLEKDEAMKAQDIRKNFVDFFQQKKHDKIESSPLVPQNDPTLLFANAGMNQFKDIFTGKENPKNKRAVSIQKCVRAGGKHNDLENVGLTARHHTFFEMLGNFSFGDYFKQEAIEYAWEFLTGVLKFPADKLFITVHDSDDEALKIWHEEIGIPREKIFKRGDKDNFWEMGEYGPCGPCSEIFYDHGPKHADPQFDPKKAQDVIDDESRYVEIWNLVFMQFEKTPQGTNPLPNPCIDTGAGLERLAAALQGVYWNYDTDCFTPIIEKLEKISGQSYSSTKFQTPFRVAADHLRSATMLITDGVLPSNEGRGYVLRRIIRRGVRYLRELGIKKRVMAELVPAVFEVLGDEYPQNQQNEALAVKLLDIEEKKFLETLDQGLKFLEEALKNEVKNKVLSGAAAFKLYDTYGFPIDLTEVILQEKKLLLDEKGFHKCMQEQKERSKKSWKGAGQGEDLAVFHRLKEKFGATKFDGYQKTACESKLLAKEGDLLIFDRTPFYGESGGQVGDSGVVLGSGQVLAKIEDTQKPVDELFVHQAIESQALEVGKTYTLRVDKARREQIKKNHSATHLLQSALIAILGDHIKQAGSLVSEQKLRFDFTHPEALGPQELQKIENLVNQKIYESLPVAPQIMKKDEALKLGAMALFGEKYGDSVRVLTMGDFSTEFCGGTHVDNTSEIGLFKILSESSLSSGVRRIEATTAQAAFQLLQQRSATLQQLERQFNTNYQQLPDRIQSLQKENRSLQKEIKDLNDKMNEAQSKDLFENPETLAGSTPYISRQVAEEANLKKLSDEFVGRHPNGVLLLFKPQKEKLAVLLRSGKKVEGLDCGKVLREILSSIGGRGGGRNDMAQGSGNLPNDIEKFSSESKILVSKYL
jgi:alanyl-tRNA synthetase